MSSAARLTCQTGVYGARYYRRRGRSSRSQIPIRATTTIARPQFADSSMEWLLYLAFRQEVNVIVPKGSTGFNEEDSSTKPPP